MRVKVAQLAALAAVGALAGMPPAATAQQVHPGEQRGLGLTGPSIPDVLKVIAANPYKAPAEPACETIPAEILALDQVLGADADEAKPKKSYVVSYAERMAGGAIRGMVPYRGAIRFLTGADHKDHELMDAARAGWARRGFLRGLEANLECAPHVTVAAAPASAAPAADAPQTIVADLQVARIPAAFAQPLRATAPPTLAAAAEPAPADASGAHLDMAAVMLQAPAEPSPEPPGR